MLADLTSGYDKVASLQIYQLILETKNQKQIKKKTKKTKKQLHSKKDTEYFLRSQKNLMYSGGQKKIG